MPDDTWTDDLVPADVPVASTEKLAGGWANTTWRVQLADGREVVVKSSATAPPGLFVVEAAGLAVLRKQGGLRTPDVLAVGPRSLTLEALVTPKPATDEFWEAAARAVAGLHGRTSPRYGWDENGWLGQLPQDNDWQ